MGFWIVNFFTFLRLVGIFFIIISFHYFSGFTTAIIALICYVSDFFDGFLARKLKCSTFFGSLFDSIADKLFIIINFCLLLSITKLCIIPIVLELLIIIIQYLKYLLKINVYSSVLGKIKMWICGITMIIIYYLTDYNSINYYGLILTPLIIIQVFTALSYLLYTSKKIDNKDLTKKDRNMFAKKTLKEVLFSHEIYEEYKNTNNLKSIYKLVKDN